MASFLLKRSEEKSAENVHYCFEDMASPRNGRSIEFSNRMRKSLYYGCYSDASLPSWPVTDVAVEVLNNAVTSRTRQLDRSYATKVARRAKISPCTLMMGMLYAERLRARNSPSAMKMSSSDLFLISVMLASKYLYDEGEDEEVFNDDWAKSGLRTTSEVNKLEMEFLAAIDWNLFISNQEFLTFVNKVETRVALTNGIGRGWFTYLDIYNLLENATFQQTLKSLGQETLKVVICCTAAYLAGLTLLIGVTAVVHSQHMQYLHRQTITSTGMLNQSVCHPAEAKCTLTRPPPQASPRGPNLIINSKRKKQPMREEILSRPNSSDICDKIKLSSVKTKCSGLKKNSSVFFLEANHNWTLQELLVTAHYFGGERKKQYLKRGNVFSHLRFDSIHHFCSSCCKKKEISKGMLDGFTTFTRAFRYGIVPADVYTSRLISL